MSVIVDTALEVPQDIQESHVLVTFIPSEPQPSTLMTLGMFRGDRQTTAADFVSAGFPGAHDDQLN